MKSKISVSRLARLAQDAYSRPVEIVPRLVLETIAVYSSRGTVYIEHIERVALAYLNIYPCSAESINMFLKQVQEIVE